MKFLKILQINETLEIEVISIDVISILHLFYKSNYKSNTNGTQYGYRWVWYPVSTGVLK